MPLAEAAATIAPAAPSVRADGRGHRAPARRDSRPTRCRPLERRTAGGARRCSRSRRGRWRARGGGVRRRGRRPLPWSRRSPTAPTRWRQRPRWRGACACRRSCRSIAQPILPISRTRRSANGSKRCSARPTACSNCPASPDDELDAYVMAGRATVAHCDVLIAVWDGLPPRGRGGTGDIVELALARGTPIIHLPVDPGRADDDPVGGLRPEGAHAIGWDPRRAATLRARRRSERLLAALLAPPPDPGERRFLDAVPRRARSRRCAGGSNIRCCWRSPGLRRLDSSKWRESRCAAAIAARNGVGSCAAAPIATACRPRSTCSSAPMAGATGWRPISPRSYRSGHVFNFLLAATRRACSALTGFRLAGIEAGAGDHRNSSWRWRSSSTPGSGSSHAGTSAGSTIASWPSDCGRCAA